MDGFRVILENRLGCELEYVFVLKEEDIPENIVQLVRASVITPGDKIRIEEAWSEND